MDQDKDFLENVVKQLVANPDEVKVERTVDELGVLLKLNVNPADIGYVIGKQGQTITALRTIIRIVGAKNNARTTIKVIEPEGSMRPPRASRPMGEGAPIPAPRGRKKKEVEIDTSVVDNLEI